MACVVESLTAIAEGPRCCPCSLWEFVFLGLNLLRAEQVISIAVRRGPTEHAGAIYEIGPLGSPSPQKL